LQGVANLSNPFTIDPSPFTSLTQKPQGTAEKINLSNPFTIDYSPFTSLTENAGTAEKHKPE
jgi:hypothetical protein